MGPVQDMLGVLGEGVDEHAVHNAIWPAVKYEDGDFQVDPSKMDDPCYKPLRFANGLLLEVSCLSNTADYTSVPRKPKRWRDDHRCTQPQTNAN